MCLLTLFLYAAGTIQEFIDSTQLALLNLYSTLGILLIISSIAAATLNFIRFAKTKKKRYVFRAGAYLLIIIFGGLSVFAVAAIIAVSGGSGV
jgi:hypothetical protein